MEATAPPRPTDEAPPAEPDAKGQEGDEEEEPELEVEGTQQQITLNVGGKKPTVSSISFEGGEIKVSGQYEKGTRLRFIIDCVVDEVATRDHRDRKTGTVTATKRKHKATMEHVERL